MPFEATARDRRYPPVTRQPSRHTIPERSPRAAKAEGRFGKPNVVYSPNAMSTVALLGKRLQYPALGPSLLQAVDRTITLPDQNTSPMCAPRLACRALPTYKVKRVIQVVGIEGTMKAIRLEVLPNLLPSWSTSCCNGSIILIIMNWWNCPFSVKSAGSITQPRTWVTRRMTCAWV
jgi:hypothetical protein